GVTIAPFSGIHSDGIRLRFSGGYGGYSYKSFQRAPNLVSQAFDVKTNYAEALVGYQHKVGIVTAKVFVGAAQIDHSIQPGDPGNRVSGSQTGVKGVVELWADLSPLWYGSLDVAYTTAHKTRSGRLRLGYRLQDDLSVGLEARANHDAQADFKVSDQEDAVFRQEPLDYVLLGAFARYEWPTGEISASAGLNAAELETPVFETDDDPTVYGTLNMLFRF
ncbi:MAG: cellulose biosynthesis protein BcsS, partial [Pseudomonadota bacterium]